MKNIVLFSFMTLTLGLNAYNLHSKPADNAKKPFAYTIILKDVDYTNGFDLENGIKTRTPFNCPLYYVDSFGLISEICPDNGMSDTVTIHHTQDQLEIVHSVLGLNFFYYHLNSGDTLSLKYEDGIPIAENPKQNLCYNLIEDNPFEKLRERYDLVLPGPVSLYPKFKTKDEIPLELERLKPFFRNLDSLYQQIKKSHAYQLVYVRDHSDSSDYWGELLNKEMRKVVLSSLFINNSDTSLYGKEENYNVYSISDRLYYKTKFNQSPDSFFNLVQNQNSGINPDLARYYFQLYLQLYLDRGEPPESINNMISQYYNTFSQHRDTIYIQRLKKNYGFEESLAEDIKIRNNAGVETNLNQLIRQDSASLYYIDYWASWCMPCLAEIPYSINLKKELENMNIRFIYLAYNDRMENWTKAAVKLNLGDYDYSYFIINSRSSRQLMDYDIKTIPRYMILDAEGKLLAFNAQRPSDPALKNTLVKLLKN